MGVDMKRGSGPSKPAETTNQGFATLIVMIAVLTIIVLFCCFAAPGVRDLCRKYVFRSCTMDDPERNNGYAATESTTPTIILLPYGRMLLVDRRMFAQLQAEHGGMGFASGSIPSILESDTTSKGISPCSLGLSPPAYEDVFPDLPPSYSELSLLCRPERILQSGRSFSDTDVNNDNNANIEVDDECGVNNNASSTGNLNVVVVVKPSTSKRQTYSKTAPLKESSM